MKEKTTAIVTVAGMLVLTGLCCYGMASTGERKDMSSKTEETSVTTNENGIVSRSYTECTVTTNGSMVTERRRETRTNMDVDGNVLETSTSEYAQSYSVGDVGIAPLSATAESSAKQVGKGTDSFLGLVFGDEFTAEEWERDPDEPAFLRTVFTPGKPLDGFDDYYVYVTPKTHRIAKIYACAKEAVEPGPNWRRHYLIEALEKRYGTWARLCSYRRPCYAFTIAPDRYVTACLASASQDYQTVIAAWDNIEGAQAAREFEELREEERKSAAEKRGQRVDSAADAF